MATISAAQYRANLDFAVQNVQNARTRQLTQQDIDKTETHPRDGKLGGDSLSLGATYFWRHAKRNWRGGNRGKALAEGLATPVAGAVAVCTLCIPGMAVALIEPRRSRSNAAVRDEVFSQSLYDLNGVVAFGGWGDFMRGYFGDWFTRPAALDQESLDATAHGLGLALGQVETYKSDPATAQRVQDGTATKNSESYMRSLLADIEKQRGA